MAKRRKFTPKFKAEVVLEALRGESSQAELCRRYNLRETQVSTWKRQLLENVETFFESTDNRSSESAERIAQLEQLVGKLTLALEIESTISGLRDAAMIRLMSDCLLRISEVVAVNVGDLKERTLTVRTSKTDQKGASESLYICEPTRKVLKRYGERAGITDGAMFWHIRRGDHIQSTRLHPPTRHAVSSKSGQWMLV